MFAFTANIAFAASAAPVPPSKKMVSKATTGHKTMAKAKVGKPKTAAACKRVMHKQKMTKAQRAACALMISHKMVKHTKAHKVTKKGVKKSMKPKAAPKPTY